MSLNKPPRWHGVGQAQVMHVPGGFVIREKEAAYGMNGSIQGAVAISLVFVPATPHEVFKFMRGGYEPKENADGK